MQRNNRSLIEYLKLFSFQFCIRSFLYSLLTHFIEISYKNMNMHFQNEETTRKKLLTFFFFHKNIDVASSPSTLEGGKENYN